MRKFQAQRLGRTGIHAGGAFRAVDTQVALDGGHLITPPNGDHTHVDGPKWADHHTQPASNAQALIDGCIGFSAIGGTSRTDLHAWRVLTLAALSRELDMIDLQYMIAGL
jgi:hypothetical protein